jgi:hypothetical protein
MKNASTRNAVLRAINATIAFAAVACPIFCDATERGLTWEKAFPLQASARGDVHFLAKYFEPTSGWHDLEVWRHDKRFLHRKTDHALDLYAVARSRGPLTYDYRVLDGKRHVAISVEHGNLYRIGVFLDWFGLAHVLDRPKQSYSLTRTRPLADEPQRGCDWVMLERGGGEGVSRSRICWSARWGVPLAIRDQGAQDVWQDRFITESVHHVARGTVAWEMPPTPTGWVHFNANQEIAPSRGD